MVELWRDTNGGRGILHLAIPGFALVGDNPAEPEANRDRASSLNLDLTASGRLIVYHVDPRRRAGADV